MPETSPATDSAFGIGRPADSMADRAAANWPEALMVRSRRRGERVRA